MSPCPFDGRDLLAFIVCVLACAGFGYTGHTIMAVYAEGAVFGWLVCVLWRDEFTS